MDRQTAVEPLIGHMKIGVLLGRNWLKGILGYAMDGEPFGEGHSLRMILASLRVAYFIFVGQPVLALWLVERGPHEPSDTLYPRARTIQGPLIPHVQG